MSNEADRSSPEEGRDSRDLLARTAKAIHTLFFATEAAGERWRNLRASLTTDAELEAYQAFSVGMINFDPLPPEVVAGLKAVGDRIEESERREAERRLSDRITITSSGGEDGAYAAKLLRLMYERWDGTLDYERGVHSFTFHSQADEKCRRCTVFVQVAIDGETVDFNTRRYILTPYSRVFDHRTERETDDVWKVLNGDLTPLLPEEPDA